MYAYEYICFFTKYEYFMYFLVSQFFTQFFAGSHFGLRRFDDQSGSDNIDHNHHPNG